MHIFIHLVLFLFASILPAAAGDLQPDLLWWSLQDRQGQPADIDTGRTEEWIATLQFGTTPFKDVHPFPAKSMENESRLFAWVRLSSSHTTATHLVPRKNSYTIPPASREEGGVVLLGARHQQEKQFSGSPVTLQTILYPKMIIADRNPCTIAGKNSPLSLNMPEIPLEILPVGTVPKQSFFKAGSWRLTFKVQYLGRPLADCPVTVLTADERTLDMTTDEHGLFSISTQQERPVTERWEHYLFTATRFDSDRDTEHIATLKVIAPPPSFGTDNIIRQAMYIGVALAMLAFAAFMAAVAMTPDTKPGRPGRR